MGFDAIWISPVVDNTDGGYHGYWAKNLSAINGHFGSPQDLTALIQACHSRGMYVMLDIVANHMGPVGTDYSSLYPFNDPSHYHDYCIINPDDFQNNQQRVENCRLAGLPDLKQENPYVQQQLYQWIQYMVQTYGFDGLRVDTTPEVPKDFWTGFSQSAGVYTVGEVFDGRYNYVAGY
jgi:alpha-amylase